MIFPIRRGREDRIAVDDLTRRRSWAVLSDRATRAARLLREGLGLAPDDHVAMLMENRVECVELTLGALLAGIWITPINRHLQPEEVAYVIEDSGARVLFADFDHADTARRSSARVVLVGEELDAMLSSSSDRAMPLDGPPGATMIYTSGTSGRPKGVKRARPATVGDALAAGAAAGTALGLDGGGAHLVTGPLYHAAPLLFAIYDQLNGAPLVIMPAWDPIETLRLIESRAIAHTHLVPTMFVRLLRLGEDVRRRFAPTSLRTVLHGAAPIAPEVKRAMIEWWGGVLVEYWGATEGGVCTLVGSVDWLAHPGSVGRPLPHWEVFAAGADGEPLPPGEAGLLYCRDRRAPRPFEYHGDPGKTAAGFLDSGAFTTGDIGRVDGDGYVYLTDRRSELIISGGVNIYPAEIEQALQRHPAVADAAVFGVPDDEWGESVKAAVELNPGYAPSAELEAELLDRVRQRLAAFKVPRSIDFEAQLPRHATGKLYRRLLRDRYWKSANRKI